MYDHFIKILNYSHKTLDIIQSLIFFLRKLWRPKDSQTKFFSQSSQNIDQPWGGQRRGKAGKCCWKERICNARMQRHFRLAFIHFWNYCIHIKIVSTLSWLYWSASNNQVSFWDMKFQYDWLRSIQQALGYLMLKETYFT